MKHYSVTIDPSLPSRFEKVISASSRPEAARKLALETHDFLRKENVKKVKQVKDRGEINFVIEVIRTNSDPQPWNILQSVIFPIWFWINCIVIELEDYK